MNVCVWRRAGRGRGRWNTGGLHRFAPAAPQNNAAAPAPGRTNPKLQEQLEGAELFSLQELASSIRAPGRNKDQYKGEQNVHQIHPKCTCWKCVLFDREGGTSQTSHPLAACRPPCPVYCLAQAQPAEPSQTPVSPDEPALQPRAIPSLSIGFFICRTGKLKSTYSRGFLMRF